MRRAVASFFALGVALVCAPIACSSGAAKYPACQTDEQCAVNGRHDYCVAGRCAYCRTSVDCGDRERCRAGACEVDPDAPPMPEAGADAEADAGEEAGDDEPQQSNEDEEIRTREGHAPRAPPRFRMLHRRPQP